MSVYTSELLNERKTTFQKIKPMKNETMEHIIICVYKRIKASHCIRPLGRAVFRIRVYYTIFTYTRAPVFRLTVYVYTVHDYSTRSR